MSGHVNINFLECYKILDITNECDWVTFRKNYKSLIQQNHPDRFTENTPEHKQSENSIRNLNAAYKVISDYYQAHKSLPPLVATNTESNTPEYNSRKKRAPVSNSVLIKKEKKKPKTLKRVIYITIIFSIFVILLLQAKTENEQNAISPPALIEQAEIIKTPPSNEIIEEESFYSIGSSLGDVIIIEGRPDKIIDTTWYYGKSSITFTKGTVSSWDRHPDSPLNIRINQHENIPFSLQSIESNKPLVNSTKKPYWKK